MSPAKRRGRSALALSERELEVLRLIGNGSSNADIADRLHRSEGTIRIHVSAVLAKLIVRDRTQAAVPALLPP